jgi:hypothetical protein
MRYLYLSQAKLIADQRDFSANHHIPVFVHVTMDLALLGCIRDIEVAMYPISTFLVTVWSSLSTDEEPPTDMKLDGFRAFHHVDTMREINRQI